MHSARLIYLLYQRSKRCAFAAAGSTGDKQQTADAARKLADNLRQTQAAAVRNFVRQQANCRCLAIAKTIYIKAAALLRTVTKRCIHLAILQ